MSADSLYDNLRSYLRLSTRVIEREGSNINVGEDFVVRITVTNRAYAANRVGQPTIVFRDPSVFVDGTRFARPNNGGWHRLTNELWPGESASVDVEFTAISEIENIFVDLFDDEEYAKIWVRGDLDQDRFFRVWNYREPEVDIHGT